jgi:hypothetical protein
VGFHHFPHVVLLVAWEFDLGSFQGFLCMCNNKIFGTHKQQNLAYCNPNTNTQWLEFKKKIVEIFKNFILMSHGQWTYQ